MTIMRNLWRFYHIIYLFGIISGNSDKSNFDEDIYELVNEIFVNYLQVFKCLIYAADDPRNGDRLKKSLLDFPWFVIDLSAEGQDELLTTVLREALEQGCGAVIVQTKADKRLAMIRAFKAAKNQVVSYRYNREKYLLLPASADDTDVQLLRDDIMYFFPNLLLVTSDATSGTLLLNSHAFFDGRKSDLVEVVDSWTPSKGFLRGVNLYPDKLKNLYGKQLVFGTIQYVPYSVIVQEGNQTIFDGIEARMAKQFVQIINGTYTAMDHPIHLWGEIFPNGTGNGIVGSVQSRRADLGYAAVYQWFCNAVDCSYPYIEADVICIVPKPEMLPSWMTILLPFPVSIWIGLCVAYIISCCFVFSISLISIRLLKGEEVSGGRLVSMALQSMFNVFRLQMQQIPRASHRNHPVAVFLKISLLFYFSISVLWQGGIASILTVPRYEKPIDTAAELVARWPHVMWGSTSRAWAISIETSPDPILQEIVKKYVILDNATLVQMAKKAKFAFFVEKLPSAHFGFRDYVNEETVPYLRTMQHYIYQAFTVIILPRGSPFMQKLNHMIHRFVENGIIQKIETQVALERVNNHLQNMILFSNEKQGGGAILTVSHIQGSLYIYFGGILISTAAFLAEKFLTGKKFIVTRQRIKKLQKQTNSCG